MTQEQMENTMNFIVERQAKFSVDLERMKESHKQRMKGIDAVKAVHKELIEQLTNASSKTFEALGELIKAQKQTDRKLLKLMTD